MEFVNAELYPWLLNDQAYLSKLITRLPHALLLYGPDGLGINNLACNWIYSIMCENKMPGGCQTCQSCTLIGQASHPDLYQLKLDDNDNKKTIGVEKIREITEFISLTTHLATHKVIFVEDANLLTQSSANALLKILEEPQPYVIFILLSNNLTRLLPTIKSRCLKHKITPPDYDTAYNYFATKDTPNVLFWLRFYNNCPLFEPEITEIQLTTLIKTLIRPSIGNIYTITQEFDGKLISFGFILDFIIKWLSDLTCYKMTAHLNYFKDYATDIASIATHVNTSEIFYLQDQINQLQPWTTHPLNYKLQIENLFFLYQQLFIKK